MNRGYVSYTKIADDKNGHRLFLGSDEHLYVADRSGSTPDSTDDGPLRLLTQPEIRNVSAFGDTLSVSWDVYKVDTEQRDIRVQLSIGCAVEAAKRLGTQLMIAGHPVVIDLPPMAAIEDALGDDDCLIGALKRADGVWFVAVDKGHEFVCWRWTDRGFEDGFYTRDRARVMDNLTRRALDPSYDLPVEDRRYTVNWGVGEGPTEPGPLSELYPNGQKADGRVLRMKVGESAPGSGARAEATIHRVK